MHTDALPRDELPHGSEVFGAFPRVLAAVASAGGALVVIGGAVWSAFRQRRLVLANTLIAAGTAITGASGLLNSVADEMTGFAVTLVVGITVIFAGFLVSRARQVSSTSVVTVSRRSRAVVRSRTSPLSGTCSGRGDRRRTR